MNITSIKSRIENALTKFKITSIKKDYTVELAFGLKSGKLTSIKKLIDEADKLMYENKKSRR